MAHVHENRWLPVYDRERHTPTDMDPDWSAGHAVLRETAEEIHRIKKKFGGFNSWHEAYAVIKEELDEFWDSVKNNDPDPYELVQVAACAQLAIIDLCDRRRTQNSEQEKQDDGRMEGS